MSDCPFEETAGRGVSEKRGVQEKVCFWFNVTHSSRAETPQGQRGRKYQSRQLVTFCQKPHTFLQVSGRKAPAAVAAVLIQRSSARKRSSTVAAWSGYFTQAKRHWSSINFHWRDDSRAARTQLDSIAQWLLEDWVDDALDNLHVGRWKSFRRRFLPSATL